jgi:hypothetical protein
MQPKPSVVTFRPVFPSTLYWNAGPAAGLGVAVRAGDWGELWLLEYEADAAAGKASPAARKLRREEPFIRSLLI